MHDGPFAALRERLLSAGIASTYVERTVAELADHYEDLCAAARASGMGEADADGWARQALGTEEALVAAALARPELRAWSERWPRAARALRALAALGLLPLWPFAYCVDRGPVIARWGLSTALASLLTGGLLLSLNWLLVV